MWSSAPSVTATVAVAFVACTACGRLAFDPRSDAGTDTPGDATSGPLLVQDARNAATATTLSATLDGAPVAGRTLVLVGAGHFGPLLTPTGGSVDWTHAAHAAANANIDIWFGTADGSSVVTIDAGSSTGYTMWVGEWAGLATTNTLDAATAGSGTASPATAGTITTTSPGDLVIFAVNDYTPNTFGTPVPATWTELDTVTIDSVQTVWMSIATTPGPVAPAVTETHNDWDAAIAAFRTR